MFNCIYMYLKIKIITIVREKKYNYTKINRN